MKEPSEQNFEDDFRAMMHEEFQRITALAQLTRTPYSEVFAAQAERLRDLYVLRGVPLPREIRRWQEARA